MNEHEHEHDHEHDAVEETPMDDPARLTAFALDELDGEAARVLETRLGRDPELEAEVEAVRRTADLLRTALRAEPAPALSAEQRRAITTGGRDRSDSTPVLFSFRRAFGTLGLAAAACFVIAIVTLDEQAPRANTDMAMELATRAPAAPNEKQVERTRQALDVASRVNALADSAGAKPEAVAGGTIGSFHILEAETGLSGRRDAPTRGVSGLPSVVDAAPIGGGIAVQNAVGGEAGSRRAGESRVMRTETAVHRKALGAAAAAAGGMAGGGSRFALDREALARTTESQRAAGTSAKRADGPALASADEVVLGEGRGRAEMKDDEDVALGLPFKEIEDRIEVVQANREEYARLTDNPFVDPYSAPLSTFSIDVDTASYANVRSMLRSGVVPPADAVRVEEMINAFDYDYAPPTGEHPFSVHVDIADAPWHPGHRLVRIGLRGIDVDRDMRPATNLVFLVDVSGSMRGAQKLPLVKRSLHLLLDNLTPDDRVAIVTYAGSSGVALPSTYCHDMERIRATIDGLQSGGSTNGGAGIVLAYEEARRGFIEGGVNRVILCTDGDFNVGLSSEGELVRLIERERESDVFLSGLGFGRGNYQDAKMEQLTNHGNGNAAYIDSIDEAQRVLVDRMAGTLVTIAKDVKIQVEFNPQAVGAYRLIGYANRMLAAEDFADDRVDAGDIGAGHTVTALYEIAPRGDEASVVTGRGVAELRYQSARLDPAHADEMFTVKLRYKQPEGDTSALLELPARDEESSMAAADDDLRFAACVASFGMMLRDSPYCGGMTWEDLLGLLREVDTAEDSRRAEFVELVERAQALGR